MSAFLDAVTGWTLFGGLVATTGAVTTRWLVLPRSHPGAVPPAQTDDVARIGAVGALALVVGLGLFFLRQLVEFRDPFSPWSDEASLLLGTAWGRTWVWASVGALVLLCMFAIARRHPAGWWGALLLVAAVDAFPALTGHAAAAERWSVLFVAADTLHVLAAGAWIGGLATVRWLSRSHRRSQAGMSLLPQLVPAFSPVAVAAVATLVATGALASWELLPSPGAFLTSTWGRLLLLKLVVLAGVLALGARNFRVLTPRLGSSEGNTAMRRSAALELAVAQVVLIVTALLVRTSPM